MLPLNPFLRAFFSSKLTAQCSDPADHVLLVPTTEFIFTHKDRETQTRFSETVNSEDFLASHILHVSSDALFVSQGSAGSSLRDGKAKARQYATLNGRIVVIKDAAVYTNKGFKTLVQSQLLFDELHYSNGFEQSPWLIYYITLPLLGSAEPCAAFDTLKPTIPALAGENGGTDASNAPSKPIQDIKTFQEILVKFPMIKRQLQSGFEQLFQQFHRDARMSTDTYSFRDAHKADDLATNSSSSLDLAPESPGSRRSSLTLVTSVESSADVMLSRPERHARRALENLVVSALSSFQRMDQQYLTMLDSSTGLSGVTIERMLERYVTEQVHDRVLFPTICEAHQVEDEQLDATMKQMLDVDIIQIGIGDEIRKRGREEIVQRVQNAVKIFKKIGQAQSPSEMGDILIDTESCITSGSARSSETPLKSPFIDTEKGSPKPAARLDADMLIPLLLLVVIRSQVRNLQSRLTYMRAFTFVNDAENGELGYVISTLEAVLMYIATDSSALTRISRTNRALWQAVKKGNIAAIKSVLYGEKESRNAEDELNVAAEKMNGKVDHRLVAAAEEEIKTETTLTHVFPFMASHENRIPEEMPKLKKRVSMDVSSISSRNSVNSYKSSSSAMHSMRSSIIADITADQLSHARDMFGNSLLMMAVDHSQLDVLKHLLQWDELISMKDVLEDRNNEGTNLFCAAVQLGEHAIIDLLFKFLLRDVEDLEDVRNYLRQQDSKGRCVAHYLFNAPKLISHLGSLLPWKVKDQNGQTPLFALCRSYDHETYNDMIESAMEAAIKHQGDGEILHLDEHVDNKKNTLLHIAHDPHLIQKLLHQCDSDPNAYNEKRFTPMMLSSKFARIAAVRIFYSDERTDLQARDPRGLTAVELAKDDEVRNRIDDMSLLSNIPLGGGRRTTIARALFVEDGSIRMVIKSGVRNTESTITVSTSRRSQVDFLNLVQCVKLEQPASWIPSISDFRSPFQIPSRPSRQTLRDIQLRLDSFLQNLITHPTLGVHETLWEFILVPDIDMNMLIDRAHRKVADRADKLKEEFTPLQENDTMSLSQFMKFASDQISSLHTSTSAVFNSLCRLRQASSDLATASVLAANQMSTTLSFLSAEQHVAAFTLYASSLSQTEHSPPTQLRYSIHGTLTSSTAILQSFRRPRSLIATLGTARESLHRYEHAAAKVSRWGISILDDARARTQAENEAKAAAARAEVDLLGRELHYTQQTIASELAAWHETRSATLRQDLRKFARSTLIIERERLTAMQRAIRRIKTIH